MKAKDLRLGNWIQKAYDMYDKNNEHYDDKQCDFMDFAGMDIYERHPVQSVINYKPILLTNEWLLKFGFTKDDISWFYSFDYDSKKETFKIAYADEFEYWFLVDCQSNGFEDVHQLQNLFFVLTGEELTIK